MTGEWTAAAEQLAAAGHELGFDAARTVASAWRARCLPEATRSLIRAACSLTSGDAKQRLFDHEPPFRTAGDFLAAAEEHEAQAAATAATTRRLAAACGDTRERAIGDHQAAVRQAAAARAGDQAEAAQETMRITAQVIGDCDAALDLLAQVSGRLGFAIACFRLTPAEYADVYDVPLQFIADGGTLPWSGDFLTPPGNSPEKVTIGAQR